MTGCLHAENTIPCGSILHISIQVAIWEETEVAERALAVPVGDEPPHLAVAHMEHRRCQQRSKRGKAKHDKREVRLVVWYRSQTVFGRGIEQFLEAAQCSPRMWDGLTSWGAM
jgi:hypothetical protein